MKVRALGANALELHQNFACNDSRSPSFLERSTSTSFKHPKCFTNPVVNVFESATKRIAKPLKESCFDEAIALALPIIRERGFQQCIFFSARKFEYGDYRVHISALFHCFHSQSLSLYHIRASLLALLSSHS